VFQKQEHPGQCFTSEAADSDPQIPGWFCPQIDIKPPIGDAHPDRYVLWEQSELIAALLDFNIRAATDGERSLDDLMRALYAEFPGPRGFTTVDIERLANQVTGQNLKPFFAAYVRRAGKLDIAHYLAMVGLQMEMKTIKAAAPDGTLMPDTRLYGVLPAGESKLCLYLTHPHSAWLRGGLRNGDQLVSVNGAGVETEGEFNDLLNTLHLGDQVNLEVIRAGKQHQIIVNVASYDWPDVTLRPGPAASQRQQTILAQWQASK
jgi:predicted metalloprotease with PDZ domain